MRKISIVTLSLLIALTGFAKKKGAPPMAAGAPGDRTCLTSKCHAGNDLNTDKATIFIEGLPKVYIANEVYDITLRLEQPKAKRFGFQATVADADGHAVGTLISLEDQNTQLLSDERSKSRTDRRYITHTKTGITGPKKGISPTWQIQWKAPADSAAIPSFYFTFNAANGNTKKTGDFIYSRSVKVKSALD